MIEPGQGDDFLSHERRGGDARVLRRRLRGLPPTATRVPAAHGAELTEGRRLCSRANRWPFRLHATYDEIDYAHAGRLRERQSRGSAGPPALVHRPRRDDRCTQYRARQGARWRHRHPASHGVSGRVFRRALWRRKAANSPPVRRCSLPASRSARAPTPRASPATTPGWRSTGWSAGRTVGGLQLYDERNKLDRTTALRLWTEGSAWFSSENGKKGSLRTGQLADIAVLSEDYFQVPEEAIKNITSVLTFVGGRIVHAGGPFGSLAPPLPPVSPSWSPVAVHGASQRSTATVLPEQPAVVRRAHSCSADALQGATGVWGPAGCSCFAF